VGVEVEPYPKLPHLYLTLGCWSNVPVGHLRQGAPKICLRYIVTGGTLMPLGQIKCLALPSAQSTVLSSLFS